MKTKRLHFEHVGTKSKMPENFQKFAKMFSLLSRKKALLQFFQKWIFFGLQGLRGCQISKSITIKILAFAT